MLVVQKEGYFMKLREPVQRYEVGKHGSEYIDYSGPAMICPECQGTNVREIEIGDKETNRNGDYICKDCGCEFDTWIFRDLTPFGKFIEKFTKVMVVIFVVLAGVCLITGAVYLFHLEKVYGYGNTPANLDKIGFIIMIGGPAIFVIIACIVYAIHEKI